MDVFEVFNEKDVLDLNIPLQVINPDENPDNKTQRNEELEALAKVKSSASNPLLSDVHHDDDRDSVLNNGNENELEETNDPEIEG